MCVDSRGDNSHITEILSKLGAEDCIAAAEDFFVYRALLARLFAFAAVLGRGNSFKFSVTSDGLAIRICTFLYNKSPI